MESSTDANSDDIRANLLRQLRDRLDAAHDLAAGVREQLTAGDVVRIEESTARLETLAQEFKLLAEELERLPAPSDEPSAALVREQDALEATALRIARSSAVTGGLLERMVGVGRQRLGLLGAARDGVYRPTGRPAELTPSGVRLKEWV